MRFKRTIRVNNTLYIGSNENQPFPKRETSPDRERITIRFHQETVENIKMFSYALDLPPARVTALLLDVTLKDSEFINKYVKEYLKQNLDPGRMKELKKVMKFINQNNPYEERISWSNLLSYLAEEIRLNANSIGEWLKK
ncbi:hypothetical protein [Bacillus sp. 1P06AnD]|uniref:hypothetical protein n=1 Tax=Bacillus sp. 1P06AnD TaxID=3132208 RepID=UPI0039A31E63